MKQSFRCIRSFFRCLYAAVFRGIVEKIKKLSFPIRLPLLEHASALADLIFSVIESFRLFRGFVD